MCASQCAGVLDVEIEREDSFERFAPGLQGGLLEVWIREEAALQLDSRGPPRAPGRGWSRAPRPSFSCFSCMCVHVCVCVLAWNLARVLLSSSGRMSSPVPSARVALAVSAALALGAGVYLILRRRRAKSSAAPVEKTQAAKSGGSSGGGGACKTLVPPTLSPAFQLEYSIHKPSRLLRNEIELVFRPDLEAVYQSDPRGAAAGVDKDDFLAAHLCAIPTWQPATQDLSEISPVVNEERRKLLVNFDKWAKPVRQRLLPKYWSDCSCPMEGTARFGTPTSTIYNELEGLTQLLRYDALPIGCCGIVLHPKWQRNAYPVTFFSTAPLDELVRVFSEVDRVGPAENSGDDLSRASCM